MYSYVNISTYPLTIGPGGVPPSITLLTKHQVAFFSFSTLAKIITTMLHVYNFLVLKIYFKRIQPDLYNRE